MPNISAHMIVAKEVGKIINIDSDDYIRGNLLPDILDKKTSHFKINNGIYMVPDINYFLNNTDFSKDINIGYLVHLLLDKHYLEDYILNKYPGENIFLDGIIYKDYDYINKQLIEEFKLDTNKITNILKKYDCKVLEEKLNYNIEYLNQKKEGKTKYIEYESFSKFLKDISKIISKELYDYTDKFSKLSIRIRK